VNRAARQHLEGQPQVSLSSSAISCILAKARSFQNKICISNGLAFCINCIEIGFAFRMLVRPHSLYETGKWRMQLVRRQPNRRPLKFSRSLKPREQERLQNLGLRELCYPNTNSQSLKVIDTVIPHSTTTLCRLIEAKYGLKFTQVSSLLVCHVKKHFWI